MTNRDQKINDFLLFFKDVLVQNPRYHLTINAVYERLTNLGISKENNDINYLFSDWINHFSQVQNCMVFVSPNWKYFCQFISRDLEARMADEHLKVYIPLDSSHIERGTIEIFEFLSKENISHVSKIASNVRFDDIVIRLIKPEDLNKLLNFVKNNNYIQEGLIPANPFAYNESNIALAVDGQLSYNCDVATLVKLYFDEKKRNQTLDMVSVDDFYQFAQNYYDKAFGSIDGQRMLREDFKEDDYVELSDNEVVDHQNILNLIIKSREKNFSYDDYIKHYKECINPQIQLSKKTQLNKLLHNDNTLEANYSLVEKKIIMHVHDILKIMGEKHGKRTAIDNLRMYIITGDRHYLTRSSGLRNRIYNSTFREDMQDILKKRNIELSEYLDIISSVTIDMEEVYLEEAIMETYHKYDEEFVKKALICLIKNGIYQGFTRDNDARKNLENNVTSYEAKRIVMKSLGNNQSVLDSEISSLASEYLENVIRNNQRKQL